jgi:tRNA modification GTPase
VITSHDTQPIVACCTTRGAGSLALIRISGNGALTVADRIAQLPSGDKISTVPTHTIHYGHVVDARGTKIDTVLFLVMHGPRTFTGHDTVEITAHNNPFLIDAIIDAALAAGLSDVALPCPTKLNAKHGAKSEARLAEPGEFSKRAVLNGKMDLLQAEALHEFIQAGTMQSLKTSYAQLAGSLSHAIMAIEKKLLHALALANASFEFIEEENLEFGAQIRRSIAEINNHVTQLMAQIPLQQQLKEGNRIALVGSVNAGKSSLFNALLGTKRAIVTPIPGTTRDVIEAGMYRQGEHQTLIDTAGIRYTHDLIEQEGIERSEQEAAKADIVLIIIDATRELSPEESATYDRLITTHHNKAIVIFTKADLPTVTHYQPPIAVPHLSVSIHDPATIAALMDTIDSFKNNALNFGGTTPYILNQRHIRLLQALSAQLDALAEHTAAKIQYEILAHHLHEALVTISELTGKSISEASMDAVFKEFCVGK